MNSEVMAGAGRSAHSRFLWWLVFTVIVLDCLVAVSVWQGILVLRERAVEYAGQESGNLAEAINGSLSQGLQAIDGSLQTIALEAETQLKKGRPDVARLQQLLLQQSEMYRSGKSWIVVDAQGMAWVHEAGLRPFSVAGREYFKRAAAGGRSGLIMSGPLPDVERGSSFIVLARALHRPDGTFAGLVVAPLDQAYFVRQLANFGVRNRRLITLRTSDLELIARHSSQAGALSQEFGTVGQVSETFRKVAASGVARATYEAVWPGDMVHRVFSVSRLQAAPILVTVGVADADYLLGWNRARRVGGIYVGLFWVLSGLIAFILLRFWQRQTRYAERLMLSNAQLNQNNEAMRTLLQVGELGLCSIDFGTGRWDCSGEQAEILGIPPDYPRTYAGWKALVHEDDLAYCEEQIARGVGRQAESIDMEYRVVRPADRSVCFIHLVARIEYLEDGTAGRLFGAIRDITALRESQKRIRHLALHDDLTGLPNRVLLAERIQHAQTMALQNKEMLAICFLDIDGFKTINDEWGHEAGNQVLVEIARRLLACIRTGDTVSRLGGDEFVVLLGGLRGESEFRHVLDRIRQALDMSVMVSGAPVSVTISAGVTIFPKDPAVEADVLIRHADNAMYEAKRRGKNRIHMFDPEGDRTLRETQARFSRISEAFRNGEFVLYYQPKVDLHSDRVVGVEALIRWIDSERGLLPPDSFLPYVENTELALDLGEWVIRQALQQKREWQKLGVDLAVSVNVFGQHLQHHSFVQKLAGILQEFPDVDPAGLELEILETSLIKDLQETSHRILDSAALGVSFSLDDFGTGYSSLSYFRKFPVRVLKIDQSFVRNILEDPEDQALVSSIVDMAHSLARKVVAEGVETLAHGLPLILCGCDYAQGYGIARPMPGVDVPAWLRGWHRPQIWHVEIDVAAAGRLLPPAQQAVAAVERVS